LNINDFKKIATTNATGAIPMKNNLQRYLFFALISIIFISLFISCANDKTDKNSLSIKGAVKDQQVFSLSDLKKMPSFFLKDHYLIKEKETCQEPGEELISLASYRGVLLRDLLLETGMKYKRKWEPGVLVKVRDINKKEVIFSFGEIFYSSIGRSILVAYEKNGKPMDFKSGAGALIISTDLRAGRKLDEIQEIVVERVEVELKEQCRTASNYKLHHRRP
jgi:hypothetical protein